MPAISARLPKDLTYEIDTIARVEKLDKSTVLRRLLSQSVDEWKKEHALKAYRSGKVSTEKAAKMAGLTLWGFFALLHETKTPLNYDLEELERDLKTLA